MFKLTAAPNDINVNGDSHGGVFPASVEKTIVRGGFRRLQDKVQHLTTGKNLTKKVRKTIYMASIQKDFVCRTNQDILALVAYQENNLQMNK